MNITIFVSSDVRYPNYVMLKVYVNDNATGPIDEWLAIRESEVRAVLTRFQPDEIAVYQEMLTTEALNRIKDLPGIKLI